MKIAIVTNPKVSNTENILTQFKAELDANNLEYQVLDIDSLDSGFDFVCVIGGDGTILKTARYYANYDTPILGINRGRLGYLSQSDEKDITKIVTAIKNKTYSIQERIMIKSGKYTALNDFVVKGSSCTRTAKFALSINDKYVCDYVADGIIISTPTGSTAYGLSAGGPILSPKVEGLVIVPICPHSLTSRPLVVPTSEKISIRTLDEKMNIAIDGQDYDGEVSACDIELSDKKAKLAFLNDDDFYPLLRNKLHWGVSITR